MGTGKEKKKPAVKILGDYCFRKYNIFHPQKNLNSGKNLRSPIPGSTTSLTESEIYAPASGLDPPDF